MNKINENIFESMSDTIDKLKDELSIVIDDYRDLRIAVIDFFVNVRNNQNPLIECIEDFESELWNYCNIGIDEEIEFYKENK